MLDSNNLQRMGCKRAAKLNLFHASLALIKRIDRRPRNSLRDFLCSKLPADKKTDGNDFVVVAIKAPIILSAYRELWDDWKVTQSVCNTLRPNIF